MCNRWRYSLLYKFTSTVGARNCLNLYHASASPTYCVIKLYYKTKFWFSSTFAQHLIHDQCYSIRRCDGVGCTTLEKHDSMRYRYNNAPWSCHPSLKGKRISVVSVSPTLKRINFKLKKGKNINATSYEEIEIKKRKQKVQQKPIIFTSMSRTAPNYSLHTSTYG